MEVLLVVVGVVFTVWLFKPNHNAFRGKLYSMSKRDLWRVWCGVLDVKADAFISGNMKMYEKLTEKENQVSEAFQHRFNMTLSEYNEQIRKGQFD